MAETVEKLSEDAVRSALEHHPEWDEVGGVIQRTFKLDDFVQAMRFVNAVADEAERVQHHPDILIRYNKVTLSLSTHDAGGISTKDFQFAESANTILADTLGDGAD